MFISTPDGLYPIHKGEIGYRAFYLLSSNTNTFGFKQPITQRTVVSDIEPEGVTGNIQCVPQAGALQRPRQRRRP